MTEGYPALVLQFFPEGGVSGSMVQGFHPDPRPVETYKSAEAVLFDGPRDGSTPTHLVDRGPARDVLSL
ncbi:MAG: hypothetical protein WA688_06430 [Thermoplasmata archaeon]